MTTGEKLIALAGATGSAAALLMMIGSGATTGAALDDYSVITTGTAMEHLMDSGGGSGVDPAAIHWIINARRKMLR